MKIKELYELLQEIILENPQQLNSPVVIEEVGKYGRWSVGKAILLKELNELVLYKSGNYQARNGIVEKVIPFQLSQFCQELSLSMAKKYFFNECESNISNWDEYSDEDMDKVLKQSYEKFGINCSINLIKSEED